LHRPVIPPAPAAAAGAAPTSTRSARPRTTSPTPSATSAPRRTPGTSPRWRRPLSASACSSGTSSGAGSPVQNGHQGHPPQLGPAVITSHPVIVPQAARVCQAPGLPPPGRCRPARSQGADAQVRPPGRRRHNHD
jgi:hypothetical protein